MKGKTFLDTSTFSKAEAIIADCFLTEAGPSERIVKLEEAFSFAAKSFNSEAALKLLELLKKTSQDKSLKGERTWEKVEEDFRSWLKEVYRQLPDKRKERKVYSDVTEYEEAIPEVKLWMLKEIARGEDEDIINFLSAAYAPHSAERPISECIEYWEIKFHGRAVFQKEAEAILQILREKLQHFPPVVIERMLFEKPLFSRGWPGAFQNAMIIARARNGGRELVQRDIRNAEFLQAFRLEERSQAALGTAKSFLGHLFRFDVSVQELKKEMQKGWSIDRAKIGESEYVDGEILLEYTEGLTDMTIMVKLPEDCSEELGRDIHGRARRHIDRWLDKGKGIRVSLIVLGGQGKLQLTYTFLR